MRGYFEIGIFHSKTPVNLGTLWRSAYQLGAAGIFTIGHRYQNQDSDTCKAWRHVPLRHYPDVDAFLSSVPFKCPIVAVEMGGRPLQKFVHPEQAIYLLGAEDHGLPREVLAQCQHHISLLSERVESYNVAVAGSVVMYDRHVRSVA